jgi:hypothetical protein
VVANIYFGVDTSLTTEAARTAAETLFQSSTEISALMESLHGTEVVDSAIIKPEIINAAHELSAEVSR